MEYVKKGNLGLKTLYNFLRILECIAKEKDYSNIYFNYDDIRNNYSEIKMALLSSLLCNNYDIVKDSAYRSQLETLFAKNVYTNSFKVIENGFVELENKKFHGDYDRIVNLIRNYIAHANYTFANGKITIKDNGIHFVIKIDWLEMLVSSLFASKLLSSKKGANDSFFVSNTKPESIINMEELQKTICGLELYEFTYLEDGIYPIYKWSNVLFDLYSPNLDFSKFVGFFKEELPDYIELTKRDISDEVKEKLCHVPNSFFLIDNIQDQINVLTKIYKENSQKDKNNHDNYLLLISLLEHINKGEVKFDYLFNDLQIFSFITSLKNFVLKSYANLIVNYGYTYADDSLDYHTCSFDEYLLKLNSEYLEAVSKSKYERSSKKIEDISKFVSDPSEVTRLYGNFFRNAIVHDWISYNKGSIEFYQYDGEFKTFTLKFKKKELLNYLSEQHEKLDKKKVNKK